MSGQMEAGEGFRSLADQLRSWDDEQMGRLLHARPDLASPAPQDSAQLAARASTRASVSRALDGLTHFELALVGAVMTSQPVLRTSLEARGEAVSAALSLLLERALVWSSSAGLRVASGVSEALAPGSFPTSTSPEPPGLPTSARSSQLVDRAAAGAAFEAVRRLELLLDTWGTRPATALRTGGLGVRELKALAARVQVDEQQAALLAEVAVAAGLAATAADEDGNPSWMPTDAFDAWSARPTAERWLVMARAWLDLERAPGLVGGRDSAGKPVNALVAELVSPDLAETRRMVLASLAELPAGEVLAATTGVPALVARLGWLRPRRSRARESQVLWAVTEAGFLGVTGLDGLSTYGRRLVAGETEGATAVLAELLPAPVDHVLLQADLTAVAPGPLEPTLARQLALVAEVESRGGATVYRFTTASVRGGLDAGWTAAEIHAFLATVSRTPVPQPLTYLVDDTARTYGSIRVGHAEAFLRADDEHALAELMHHPKASTLGLRRIAPTVLISTTPIDILLPRLRELGAAPVVEAADGSVHIARPDAHRARLPRSRRSGAAVAVAREAARVPGVVAAIRAGDAAAASRPRRDGPLSPADALAELRDAIDSAQSVVLTYVDNHGTLSDRVVAPRAIREGQLLAEDQRSAEDRMFAIHRIRDVRAL
ncbi:helicase-associated domain-containing protein [Nocardioides sp. Kera G14]|uniref:helicase-associated domain-containing protein n=1 Tax=Nocardioides sp. Kera G14 TaxID=2884264 RepID=UPI001D128543|nr:helicase-associated domain-containing protein [Nocardioides sp. Kera G14]UDY24223.1 helicase C-terminal domain-containing protein [Nocardioides sp. Kera G14]